MSKTVPIFAPPLTAEWEPVRSVPWMGVVVPGGWLDGLLRRVSNPRKHRWNAYLRACKRIPAGSPVAGSTSFQTLNSRRHDLIEKQFEGGGLLANEKEEFQSLQKATSEWLCGGMVCDNLVLARVLRRLEYRVAWPRTAPLRATA